ncbi:MAG: hypothetical protein OSJ54_13310 [Oscillospiraceae bacterium]|nr:hypothetical protein [Oscillospiraceae bacterium]
MPENENTTPKTVQENEAKQVKELLVMRTQIIPAMNLGTETAPDWAVCGRGWKKFSESPNAQTESVKYINMESEATDTTSYSPKYAFECDLMASERTVKEVYSIAKGRKTGSDCVRPFLVIDKFDPVDGGGYVAWYEKLAVAVSSIDGDKKMTVSGDLNAQGDTVKGVATISADGKISFTPDSGSDTNENA